MKTIYSCTKCGNQFPKWSGRCLECGAWGTLNEEVATKDTGQAKEIEYKAAEVIDLSKTESLRLNRIKSGMAEVDRVLGGGMVPGSLILLSGEPGIGKSTILGQICNQIGRESDNGVIYVSGEESASQVKNRLDRLSCDLKNIRFVSETSVEKIIAAAKQEKPSLLVIDSIQTVYSEEAVSETGGVSQIRISTIKFLELAKQNDIAVMIVGHVTKDGQVAGPKTLEHIVDTVVHLETELKNNYRILRANKNRFGSVNEIGIFEMSSQGFIEVKNPGSVFIESGKDEIPGTVVSAIMEGTRPFLVEIQALVTKTVYGYPQRKAAGFDQNRLQLLTAVLTKKAGINLTNQDVIVNVVGGLRVNDTALDLAVCLAIASALLNYTIKRDTLVLGEVGLGGEIRRVARLKERIGEAGKLGFKKIIAPDTNIKIGSLELLKVNNLDSLVRDITEKKY